MEAARGKVDRQGTLADLVSDMLRNLSDEVLKQVDTMMLGVTKWEPIAGRTDLRIEEIGLGLHGQIECVPMVPVKFKEMRRINKIPDYCVTRVEDFESFVGAVQGSTENLIQQAAAMFDQWEKRGERASFGFQLFVYFTKSELALRVLLNVATNEPHPHPERMLAIPTSRPNFG